MAQRIGGIGIVDGDRVEAHLLDRPGKHLGAQRGGHHLRAEAHPQGGPVRRQPGAQAAQLAGDPGVAILLIDPHRAAHHDHQIGLAQVQRGESGIGHVDPVDHIAGRLDRIAKPRHPFVGHMADDQGTLHWQDHLVARTWGCTVGRPMA